MERRKIKDMNKKRPTAHFDVETWQQSVQAKDEAEVSIRVRIRASIRVRGGCRGVCRPWMVVRGTESGEYRRYCTSV